MGSVWNRDSRDSLMVCSDYLLISGGSGWKTFQITDFSFIGELGCWYLFRSCITIAFHKEKSDYLVVLDFVDEFGYYAHRY